MLEVLKQPEGLVGALIALLLVLERFTRIPKQKRTPDHEIVVRLKT